MNISKILLWAMYAYVIILKIIPLTTLAVISDIFFPVNHEFGLHANVYELYLQW